MPRLLGGGALRDRAKVAEYTGRSLKPNMLAYYAQMTAAQMWSFFGRPRRIDKPTLVIAGTADPIFAPPDPDQLEAMIASAQLKLFDSGHLLVHLHADEAARDVTTFLDG